MDCPVSPKYNVKCPCKGESEGHLKKVGEKIQGKEEDM